MFALERQKHILEQLSAEGAVWVSRLSAELCVTEETIRRDLEKLEKQEMLRRTHGGAVSLDESSFEMSLEKRKHTNVEIKERLAREAITHVNTGDTIFLDASTTTFYMARALKKMKNITVITNSLRVLNELDGQEGIRVIAVGGVLSKNQSFVGSLAEESIRDHYFASKMFLSGKGLTETAGFLESNEQECAVKRRMLENSKTRYFLCDQSKFGRVGFVKLARIEEMDYFITDAELSDDWKQTLAEHKVELISINDSDKE
ncbi:MAG: DeoR/GlpR transcriptional regulator [Ruminococcaceae bacterium]|nr:DeoR/GlpR transcriptional regulator [Oscillospiraceae bacterium]